jgi:aryl-alcohol dehydrogenase-like predicted oxidoreductase
MRRPATGTIVDAVEAVAKARNTSMAQVAMAWVLQKPVVTSPIVGVSKMSHLEDAIAAVDFELTTDDIKKLEAPYKPLHVGGF